MVVLDGLTHQAHSDGSVSKIVDVQEHRMAATQPATRDTVISSAAAAINDTGSNG
jgi:hypothetical protein